VLQPIWLRLAIGSEGIPLTAKAPALREGHWTSPG